MLSTDYCLLCQPNILIFLCWVITEFRYSNSPDKKWKGIQKKKWWLDGWKNKTARWWWWWWRRQRKKIIELISFWANRLSLLLWSLSNVSLHQCAWSEKSTVWQVVPLKEICIDQLQMIKTSLEKFVWFFFSKILLYGIYICLPFYFVKFE